MKKAPSQKSQTARILLVEYIGTILLALAFLSTAFLFDYVAPWYIGLTVGVALCMLTLAFQTISGAHLNPALTVLFSAKRLLKPKIALAYIVTQLLAGVTALYLYEYISNTIVIPASASDFRVMSAEVVGSFVFGLLFATVLSQKCTPLSSAAIVGFGYFLGIVIAAPAGMVFLNPALALAHDSLSVTTAIAPILGIFAGFSIYGVVFGQSKAVASSTYSSKSKPKRKKA